jgi:hypothetical protein
MLSPDEASFLRPARAGSATLLTLRRQEPAQRSTKKCQVRLQQAVDEENAANRQRARHAELQILTNRNPDKYGCQVRASSEDDSTYAGYFEIAGLQPEREIKQPIDTSGKSFKAPQENRVGQNPPQMRRGSDSI